MDITFTLPIALPFSGKKKKKLNKKKILGYSAANLIPCAHYLRGWRLPDLARFVGDVHFVQVETRGAQGTVWPGACSRAHQHAPVAGHPSVSPCGRRSQSGLTRRGGEALVFKGIIWLKVLEIYIAEWETSHLSLQRLLSVFGKFTILIFRHNE